MKKRVIGFLILLLLLLGYLSSISTAVAVESNKACVNDAKDEYEDCKAACKEQFWVERDLCVNVKHDCADQCRAAHSACVDPFLDGLDICKETCDSALKAQKQLCRSQFGEGTKERDTCIDNAQIFAYICRDTCREGVIADLKKCTKALHACIQKCPPAK